MAVRARRHGGNGLDAWPGYVDALSTLVMVIIFVLLVSVLAQAFLAVVLSGRDKAPDQVKSQLAVLTNMWALEKSHGAALEASIAQLNQQLATSNKARDALLAENQKLYAEQNSLTKQLAAKAAQVADMQYRLAVIIYICAINTQGPRVPPNWVDDWVDVCPMAASGSSGAKSQ